MSASASERPVLRDEQKLALNYLKLTWARFYALNCDGVRWTAIPLGTETVISAGSKDELHKLLMADAHTRINRAGHWIETASGPPYFVDTSDPRRRTMRS
jgi:hypothetical protein